MKQLLRYKWPIGCSSIIAMLITGLFVFGPMLDEASRRSRTEADFRKLADSDKTDLYSYYPELIDRVATDLVFAKQIKRVYLTHIESDGDYSSLALLPNVEQIEVTYGHDVDKIIPAINQMPALKRAHFYYCDSADAWLPQVNNKTLESLHVHDYQVAAISADKVAACQANMPACEITVSDDESKK